MVNDLRQSEVVDIEIQMNWLVHHDFFGGGGGISIFSFLSQVSIVLPELMAVTLEIALEQKLLLETSCYQDFNWQRLPFMLSLIVDI